ncbi:Tetratricopeptide TPR_1 repeat-containing protein [Desulfobulbus propionicus DSM 2032]|uniref:Tetratricopeptide TPR_1 repeat-containing protein n=1 Tax=Desulfobulbus propionicus (strain ATCC 33891 / DSM 2032 / VKM B-1956 / 1pr3) TaxID=577650 RepID=A0A7U3YMQ2_DESPD|nr:tetratricopeptide repeat protein [Desulfobulbus propionicus]ADW18228.1 Tetratricopeptide TPR_1 repeat-containing protein [Desulfobulbus propionicus DSM 2032]
MNKTELHVKVNKIYIIVAILLLACYSNAITVPWHLDDPPNITENYPLHITDLQPETLWQTLFAKPFSPGTLERPVAYLSFALNWYVGQDNPIGYHLVNLLIHILTAFFLFKTTFLLLQSPRLEKYSEDKALFIALLSATLWAINPIQTQAVTYIVQRMASMAAMFFIFSTYNYIRARQSETAAQTIKHFSWCILFFALALGCKENAITLIPSLLLIELLFFYRREDKQSKISLILLVAANSLLLLGALYYSFHHQLFGTYSNSLTTRPFTPYERLLTQPSVLLFYLSLLLYPSPARLSIDHSFPLSTSLVHPWTTLPAIVTILGLVLLGILCRKKWPLLSLALLFFFINHLVESTFIPLELVFEHRNYLPSFFLFLPIAATLGWALNYTAIHSKLLYGTLVVFIPLLLFLCGLGTYSRNVAWKTEESLWTDSLSKAPTNARPYAKLAEIYGWRKEKNAENFKIALALLHQSLERESPRTSYKPALVGNIGKLYAKHGLLDQAVLYYNQSLQLNPDFITSRFDLAEALTLQGKFSEALTQINTVIAKNDLQSRFFNLKALLLLWLDRPQEAAGCSQQAMQRTMVNKERYFYNTGVALGRAGHLTQGQWFLKQALHQHPNDRRILYSLIENRLLAKDVNSARQYALFLLENHSVTSYENDLAKLPTDYSAVPVNISVISPLIVECALQAATNLEKVHSQRNQ